MASEKPKTAEELEVENSRLKEGFQIGGTAKLIVYAIMGVVVLQVAVNVAVGFLQPGADNKPITDPINDSLNKVIAGLFAAGLWQVHKSVNSIKTELVERTAESEFAKGQLDTSNAENMALTASDKRDAREEGRAEGIADTTDQNRRKLTATDKTAAHEAGRVEGVAEGRAENKPPTEGENDA